MENIFSHAMDSKILLHMRDEHMSSSGCVVLVERQLKEENQLDLHWNKRGGTHIHLIKSVVLPMAGL